jgi:hypothetical protein
MQIVLSVLFVVFFASAEAFRLQSASPTSRRVMGALSMASEAKKKVLVLGGDGFCGWPTSLYLSDRGILIFPMYKLEKLSIIQNFFTRIYRTRGDCCGQPFSSKDRR